ncbi:MAG: hypothetical protein DI535_09125 [Citrobacter freundii]|nr:MAG: hypothetical protein DI535_09125 [Citrobacter freundii]
MKKNIAVVLVFYLMIAVLPQKVCSQSVAINSDSSKADPSAILDLKSFKKGFLVPRMTMEQRDLIPSPAIGLLIYQTNGVTGFYYYDGTEWIPLKSAGGDPGTGNHWSVNDGDDIFNTNIGNVGIGTVLPKTKLTIKTPLNTSGFMHVGVTDSIGTDSIIVKESIGGISAAIGTQSNHPFRFITNDIGRMTILENGNVLIGDNTTPELGRVNIQMDGTSFGLSHTTPDGQKFATLLSSLAGGIGTFSNTNMLIYANNIPAIRINGSNQNVGIGTTINPTNKFQIGDFGFIGYGGADLAIGHANQAMAISIFESGTGLQTSNDLNLYAPHVSVNTSGEAIRNKFQIGNVGATGYNGNDLAFGNNLNATGFAQTNSYMQMASSTNMALMPVNGNGRVGINTTAPKAQLDVEGFTKMRGLNASQSVAYYGLSFDFEPQADYGGVNSEVDISIFASNNMMALQFDAFSDARIKNITGISNSANDLKTINALQITDYSFKDKIKNGNKLYKKVIAQQVETVYPQVVSKHVDFVPNVYQLTSKIEKVANGYLLSFSGNHNISKEAKKLEVIMEDNGSKKEFDIVSIPSSSQVIIGAGELKADRLFVYGEQVNDFRTVDYEGLTTLNISATQELSKQITELQKIVAMQKEQIETLLKTVITLKSQEITKK